LSRGDTKVLLECRKYFTSERSEPTTALKHVSHAFKNCSDKGEICYLTMVTLIFSRVKMIASFHAKAYLVRYFVGLSIINTFLSCSINLFVNLCFTRMTAFVQFRKTVAS